METNSLAISPFRRVQVARRQAPLHVGRPSRSDKGSTLTAKPINQRPHLQGDISLNGNAGICQAKPVEGGIVPPLGRDVEPFFEESAGAETTEPIVDIKERLKDWVDLGKV